MSIVLRRSFGARHVDVRPFYKGDNAFGLGDLAILQRFNKNVCSIAGHSIRPVAGLERLRDDVQYFTFLREPISRYVSLYRFRRAHGLHDVEFDEAWVKNPWYFNEMTRFIAGKPDADAAFKILRDRVLFVGLQERFDESLLMLKRKVAGGELDIHYGHAANVTPTSAVAASSDLVTDELRPMLVEANRIDIELYERVVNELYPQQMAEYGPNLAGDLEAFKTENAQTPARGRHLCSIGNLMSKVLYNKPINLVSRKLRKSSPNSGRFEHRTIDLDEPSS